MNTKELNKLIKLLPEIAGINGREEFFNSAVLALIFELKGEYHFILQKRSSHIRQGGEICFPGGRFDPLKDKSFEETAIRETIEELGIPFKKIKILGNLDTIVAPMGATVEGFLAVAYIQSLDELGINKNEVEDVFSIPVSYFVENEPELYKVIVTVQPSYIDKDGKEIVLFPAQELGLPEMYTRPWGNIKNNIYVYKLKDRVVWGLTARFIYDISMKLRNLKIINTKTMNHSCN